MKERLRAAGSHEMGRSEVSGVLCGVWGGTRDHFLAESPSGAQNNRIRSIWGKSPHVCVGQSQQTYPYLQLMGCSPAPSWKPQIRINVAGPG